MADKAKGGEIIHVNIRGPLQEVQAKLGSMEKIKGYTTIDDKEEGLNRFEIKSDIGVDLSEELFFLVSQNGWSLTELYKEVANLENIFLELTTKED